MCKLKINHPISINNKKKEPIMNTIYEPIDTGMIAECRDGFSTRLLTDPQFEEFVSICTILNREIHKSGSFIEKLENYAFTISRSEKGINAGKADTIIRDLFKGMFGQSMDQMRKELQKNEEELSEDALANGYDYAIQTLKMIEKGNKIAFHRAYAHQAALMATELSITDIAAKRLMSEQYEAQEGHEFYEAGKQVEDKFYTPQIEAEKRSRGTRGSSQYNRSGYSNRGSNDKPDTQNTRSSQNGYQRQPQPTNG